MGGGGGRVVVPAHRSSRNCSGVGVGEWGFLLIGLLGGIR